MSYSGIFVRDDINQYAGQAGSGGSSSPDILFSGTAPTDPTQYATAESYATGTDSNVTTGVNNYVYARGLNTNTSSQVSNIFLYYTESDLILWPKNWRGDNMTVGGVTQNWSPVMMSVPQKSSLSTTWSPSVSPGVIGVSPEAFVWTPPTLQGSPYDHYCMISWADNSATPTPPDFSTIGQFSDCSQMAAFVQSHLNMGWRNTQDVYGTPATQTYSTGLSLQGEGGTVNLSISFYDIPLDGTFNVELQGTDSSNTLSFQGLKLSDFRGGFNKPNLSYPPNFNTSVQVEWFRGATDPSPAGQVEIALTIFPTQQFFDECRRRKLAVHDIRVELFEPTVLLPQERGTLYKPTPVVLLGRQTWAMKYGLNPPTQNVRGDKK